VADRPQRDRWTSWAGSCLLYGALSILITWPLLLHMGTHLAGRDQDLLNVYWGDWWVRRALAMGTHPYQTRYLLYPIGFDLTTFAFSPALALLSIPLSWVLSLPVAYNLTVLVTIVLSGLAMEALVRYLSGKVWAARVAALSFVMAPAIAAERFAHLNLSMLAWIPLAALFLTRIARQARLRDVGLYALTVGLAFLTRLHVGALVLLFSGVYFVALTAIEGRAWPRRAWLLLPAAGLLSLLIVTPLGLRVSRLLAEPGGEDVLREGAETHQTDVLAYVLPPNGHPLFGRWTAPLYAERFPSNDRYWAYLGFVPLALAVYIGIARPAQAGPWLLAALVLIVLALGPSLRVGGTLYPGIRLPYGWAGGLFSALGFDVPNRFNLAVMPALSVLAGLAYAELARHGRKVLGWAVPVAIAAEYVVVPIPLYRLPAGSPFYAQMAADEEAYAVVDLPLTRAEGEVHRYYQTIHGKPIVGGWDHRVPSSAFAFIDSVPLLQAWSGRGAPNTPLFGDLGTLADAGVRYIVLHKDQTGNVPAGMEGAFSSLRPAYRDEGLYVWSTDTSDPALQNVAQSFAGGLQLLEPAVTLATDGTTAELSASICWSYEGIGAPAGEYQVSVTGPDGSTLAEERVPLPGSSGPLSCRAWSWPLPLPLPSGDLQLEVTPLAEDSPLGTYVSSQPIAGWGEASGQRGVLLGKAYPVHYEAPVEMTGYRVVEGEGAIWLDLYWQALADHEQAYKLFSQLIDPLTGVAVANSDDLLPQLAWRAGDVLQAHRVLFADRVPQGLYRLAFGLSRNDEPGQRIPATDPASGERWPGDLGVLPPSVLVLPRALEGLGTPHEGRVLVYTDLADEPTSPQHETDAQFGDAIRLTGYALAPEEARSGEAFGLTLFWSATTAPSAEANAKVFVHLVDPSGRMLAQHDGEPVQGRRPVGTWQAGDLVIDTHALVWQVDAYTGPATIYVGLYDPVTGERVPVSHPGSGTAAGDAWSLGQIQIR
jgi:hypothetical protein